MSDKCKHENISLYTDQFRCIRCYVEFKPVTDEPDTEARLLALESEMRDVRELLAI